ncbi:hypothetical protein DM860_014325 [Cuscuta australis]|uniref:Pectinesterase n=1 Tax=Cuscuta australis TaxID=267555 RepID=A0A328DE65_9ASTE|nr:hypothetical protein DM860_014325 [Cuscuta australis]
MSTVKEQIAGGESTPGDPSAIPDRKKKTFIVLFASFLVVSAVVGVVSVREIKSTGSSLPPAAHAIVKSTCASTRFQDLCFSAIASSSAAARKKITTQKDVIALSINITHTVVEQNYFTIKKILNSTRRRNLTAREVTALHDCLEMVDETLDELQKAAADLEKYPATDKSLKLHADDLKTLISSALTNQDTCLDGFSHEDADKEVRDSLVAGQNHVENMCSNALAMIKNMTDSDILEEQRKQSRTTATNRKLKEEAGGGWPEWMPAGTRRLLQSPTVEADVVVAADGSGNYTTVTEAVANAPEKSSKRYVIKIKAGVYRENVEVPKKKTNIMFLGDGRTNTIITGNRNVVDGTTTFHSATVAAVGPGFLARDITFQNTAGQEKHQAVALRVGSDLSAFYRCDILAYQDTLYVHSNRHFFVECLIAGTVDFIFGNGAAVFQDCDIHARRPGPGQKNMITAQGRKDPGQNTGIVIQNCRIGATSDLKPDQANFPTYLGRPWKEFSRTVIMQSSISDVVHPAGWHEWAGDFALETLVYGEYANTGDGANTAGRVNWKGYKVITNASEAEEYAAEWFIAGGMWLNGTGFPYTLGLKA